MSRRELRTGNILLIDVIRYSPRADDFQSQIIEILNRLVNETPTMADMSEEDRLFLPTGDGLAVAFFKDPRSPIYCAMELDKRLRAYNSQVNEEQRFGLRMGINQGLVYVIKDINERNNLAGDGINRVQRVTDCGDSGHILISQEFADSLARADSTLATRFHSLGEFEVKHGEKITIANIHDAEHGNPEMPTRRTRVAGTLYDAAPALRIMFAASRPLTGYYRENSQGQLALINPSLISSDVFIYPLLPPENCMETKELFRALQKAEAPVEISVFHGITAGGLVEVLNESNFRVLHFDGHGSRHGSLIFENLHGEAHLLAPELLARIASEQGIGLIYLRASHVVDCVEAIRSAGVPAVVGMADTIKKDLSTAFISRFYSELAKGSLLKEAFERARLMIKLMFGTTEDAIHLSADDENIILVQIAHQRCPPIFNSHFTKLATPPRSDTAFVGREKAMVQLINKLSDGGIVELLGEDGIGKTALGKMVAQWHIERGRFPGGVFWINLMDGGSITYVWDSVGVGINGDGFRNLMPKEKLQFLNRYMEEKPSLIVVDSSDAISEDSGLLQWLMGIQSPSAALVISEQDRGMGKGLLLQELSQFEARRLFINHAVQKGWATQVGEKEENIVDEICDLIERIPLAIILMASRASVSALDMLAKEIKLSLRSDSEDNNAYLPERYRIVNACLNVSYRMLSSDEVRQLFRRLLMLGSEINDELIRAICGISDWRPAVSELVRVSLLNRQDDNYYLHQLVRQYAKSQLEVCGETYAYRQKAEDAQRYYLRTREIKEELGDRSKIATSLTRLSTLYKEQDDLSTAIRFLAVAHDIFSAIGSASAEQTKHELDNLQNTVGEKLFDKLLKSACSRPDEVIREAQDMSRRLSPSA